MPATLSKRNSGRHPINKCRKKVHERHSWNNTEKDLLKELQGHKLQETLQEKSRNNYERTSVPKYIIRRTYAERKTRKSTWRSPENNTGRNRGNRYKKNPERNFQITTTRKDVFREKLLENRRNNSWSNYQRKGTPSIPGQSPVGVPWRTLEVIAAKLKTKISEHHFKKSEKQVWGKTSEKSLENFMTNTSNTSK